MAEEALQEQVVKEVPAKPAARSPRRGLVIVSFIALIVFIYHLIADRLTPYTSTAQVQAYIVQMAPRVPGHVVSVPVTDNRRVNKGEILFELDPAQHRVAMAAAEAALERAGQDIGASTAQVAAAQARVTEVEANLAHVLEQTNRTLSLVKRGVYASSRGDEARAQLKAAEAELEGAQADLEQARQRLGPQGTNNPQIRAAMADLERAKLDLLHTKVAAPLDGLVTNLQLTEGQYINAGSPAMTFIDIRTVWVSASFRENSLGNLNSGDKVEIVLDVNPGRIYRGTLESIGWGVAQGQGTPSGELPSSEVQRGWLRPARRFPVRIVFEGEKLPQNIRVGSQANVIVYATDNQLLNALGWLWIRLISMLTYAY